MGERERYTRIKDVRHVHILAYLTIYQRKTDREEGRLGEIERDSSKGKWRCISQSNEKEKWGRGWGELHSIQVTSYCGKNCQPELQMLLPVLLPEFHLVSSPLLPSGTPSAVKVAPSTMQHRKQQQ